MSRGAPDGILLQQIAVTVENVAVAPAAAVETPVCKIGRYSGTSQSYQTIATWTVAALKVGELKEVAMASTEFGKTYFQLVVDSTEVFTEKMLVTSLNIPFVDTKLLAGKVVTLSARSSDGTSFVANGSITGKEIG